MALAIVADVRSAGLFGAAVATLNFEITNKGDTADELVLTYWYANPEGKRCTKTGRL